MQAAERLRLPLFAIGGITPDNLLGLRVLGVDRVLDMVRTMTNVGSDVVTTVVVDAQERKIDAAST